MDEMESEESTEEQDLDDKNADAFTKIREEVTNMTFEELLLLKERLGTKTYNAAMFPSAKKPSSEKKIRFQRENKNRPTEVSSKKRVSELRTVVPIKKKVIRDPRFDDLSGNYNETYFNQAYEFISDIKQREKQKLVKTLKHEKDPKKRLKIEQLLKKMAQKEKAEAQKESWRKKEKEIKTKERELVAKGKKPYFIKKSEKKRLEMEEKKVELEAAGKMDKYLKKQSKKTLAKERKHLVPFL